VKVALQQGTEKTAAGFERKLVNTIDEVPGQVKKHIHECSTGLRCFPAGTLVLMADGSSKPIEDIKADDYVMADDPMDENSASARQVTGTVSHWTQSLVEIHTDRNQDGLSDGSFQATANHPMWTLGRGWTQAGDISPGESLLDVSGAPVSVLTVTAFNHTCGTYNLTVDDDHSYFVFSGAAAVLAHNTNPGPRAWIIYQGKMPDASGDWHYYTGKASMPSGSADFKPQKVFEKRYSKTNGRLRRPTTLGKTMDLSFDDITVLHQFWDDGSPSDILSRSSGRPRTKGAVTAQALEAYEEFKWREDGFSLNSDKPLSGKHPHFDDILDIGENYLQTAHGGQPCSGLTRIR
jgi:hypothetical protein